MKLVYQQYIRNKLFKYEIEHKEIINKAENSEETIEEDNSIKFDKLEKINSDIVTWINIDSTNMNYPIYKTDNNQSIFKGDGYNTYGDDTIALICDNLKLY